MHLEHFNALPLKISKRVAAEELFKRQLDDAKIYVERISESECEQYLLSQKDAPKHLNRKAVFEAACWKIYGPRIDLARKELISEPTQALSKYV